MDGWIKLSKHCMIMVIVMALMSPPGCQCVPEVSGKSSKSEQEKGVNRLFLLLEMMHV